jgi:hypothetical protein
MGNVFKPSDLVAGALECSVYHQPKAPGLSVDEIHDVGSALGFQRGEIHDAIERARTHMRWGQRLVPSKSMVQGDFTFTLDPDFRNIAAFDFVPTYFRTLIESVGRAEAKVSHDVLVANGVGKGLPGHDLEVAITTYVLAGHLLETGGMLSLSSGHETHALPSEQLTSNRRDWQRERPQMKGVYEAVSEVIGRRTNGRPKSGEPVHAFERELDDLGMGHFRVWWSSTASELSLANPAQQPTTVCVMAAALAEAALTFVVKRARDLGLATMASKTFDDTPGRWGFDELLTSAAAGGTDAILDARTRERAARLSSVQQRIHAGRLLAEHPRGPIPDMRAEEPREARETLDAVLRRIIDWLATHPRPKSTS